MRLRITAMAAVLTVVAACGGSTADISEIPDLPPTSNTELTASIQATGVPAVVNVWASWCGPCRSEAPLLANMTEYGKTPYIHVDRFGELGYQLVIYPLSMQRLAMGHVARGLRTLKTEGTVEPLLDAMQTRQELYDLLGYVPGTQWNFPGSPS